MDVSESKKADGAQRTDWKRYTLGIELSNLALETLTPEKRLEQRYPDDSTIGSGFSLHINPYHVDQVRAMLVGTIPTHVEIAYNLEMGIAVLSFADENVPGATEIRWNPLFTTFDVAFRDPLRLWNVGRIPAGKVMLVPTEVRTDLPGAPVCFVLHIAGRKLVSSPRPSQTRESTRRKAEKAPASEPKSTAASDEPTL